MNIKLFGLALALLELAVEGHNCKESSNQYSNGAENQLVGRGATTGQPHSQLFRSLQRLPRNIYNSLWA